MLIADYEKQYEDYRDAHPLTEAEMNSPRYAEARRKSKELEELSWDPKNKMKIVPGGYLDERGEFVLEPMVREQMNIAIDRAQAQFDLWDDAEDRSRAMPGDAYDSLRYPNKDPKGKYSIIELELQERYNRVRDTASVRPEEVGRYIGMVDGLEKRLFRDKTAQLTRYGYLPEESKKYRLYTRAEKLCLDPTGRALLHQKALEIKNSPNVVRCEQYMQGLEYMSGVRRGPIPEEVLRVYREAGIELDPQIQEKSRQVLPLEEMTVEFEDYDNGVYHRFATMPENWDLPHDEIERKFDAALEQGTIKPELLEGGLPPYARATVDSYLDPYFLDTERLSTSHLIDRSTLVIIDGKTVRERMLEDYMEQNRAQGKRIADFENEYEADPAFRYRANEYVAAALMAGKRVEAFVPDAAGKLPEQPMRIVKDGYTPTPLKKVTLSLWERFASKFGFYKEKVAEAKEYERAVEEKAAEEARMSAARERVKADYTCSRFADLGLTGADNRELFFGNYMRTHGGQMPPPVLGMVSTRSTYQTLAVCHMIKEGNGRYPLEDLLDPEKLREEKQRAGDAVAVLIENKDVDRITDLFLHGQLAVVKYMDEKVMGGRNGENGIDLMNVEQLATPEGQMLLSVIKFGYDASQEVQRRDTKESYKRAFEAYSRANNIRESESEAVYDPITTASIYVKDAIAAMRAGLELSRGLVNEPGADGMDMCFSNIVTMQAEEKVFREAQAKKPGVPFHRLLSYDEYVASGASTFASPLGMYDSQDFAIMKGRLNEDKALQRKLGYDAINGKTGDSISVNLKGKLSCKFKEPEKAAEHSKRAQEPSKAKAAGRSR